MPFRGPDFAPLSCLCVAVLVVALKGTHKRPKVHLAGLGCFRSTGIETRMDSRSVQRLMNRPVSCANNALPA